MVFDALHLAIILFLTGGTLFAVGPLIMAALLAPRAKDGALGAPYECGMQPLGSAWTRYGISFYMYALVFIAFDVDVLYLFPATVYYHLADGWGAFFKLAGFLFFLVLALIYFRAKGVFTWPSKIDL